MASAQDASVVRRWSATVALLVSAVWFGASLGGCTGGMNTSDQLLGAEPLPALVVAPEGFGERGDGPSLRHATDPSDARRTTRTGWDRRHWDPVVVSVPRGQVETNPAGAARLPIDRSLPRQRGEFPVDAEVLDGTGPPGAVALDAIVNLAAAPGLLLLGPLVEAIDSAVCRAGCRGDCAGDCTSDRNCGGVRWPWSVVRHQSDQGIFNRGSAYDRLPPDSPRSPWPWLGVDPDPDELDRLASNPRGTERP